MTKGLLAVGIALVTMGGLGAGFAACGGNNGTTANGDDGGGTDGTMGIDSPLGSDGTMAGDTAGDGNGGSDGSSGGGDANGSDAGSSSDASLSPDVFNGNGGCLKLGSACGNSGDCCTNTCTNGVCSYPPCVSDNQPCSSGGQCCSQTCGMNGLCTPLSSGCGTLGNACTNDNQCCSNRCVGTCQPSSFCSQPGEICAENTDCCTGVCTIPTGKNIGTCALNPPGGAANCGLTDGMLCAGTALLDGGVVVYVDGGPDGGPVPKCGGACCSRACAPWGPTGVLVCQPASGCKVVGDICTTDDDCCGSAGDMADWPSKQKHAATCSATGPGGVGVCQNPNGCKPNGDVCKLSTTSCNASCDCCAGNCEGQAADGGYANTCRQDNVGVPRCASPGCVDPAGGCSSSADCCNGNPCTPNPDGGLPPYICAPTQCIQGCGQCSNNADCCPGYACTNGVCDPCGGPDGGTTGDGGSGGDAGTGGSDSGTSGDSGPPCSLYGQLCNTAADCCNELPCNGGRCEYLQ